MESGAVALRGGRRSKPTTTTLDPVEVIMAGFDCAHGHTWPSPLAAEECDCMDPDAATLHLV